jgi:malate synthase
MFLFMHRKNWIPGGTIKATVLIENLLAAFEMDEILYELKEHSAGLLRELELCFQFYKKLRNYPHFIFPDRSQITMVSHCMNSLSLLMIKICHKRNAYAIGGISAYVPVKENRKLMKLH